MWARFLSLSSFSKIYYAIKHHNYLLRNILRREHTTGWTRQVGAPTPSGWQRGAFDNHLPKCVFYWSLGFLFTCPSTRFYTCFSPAQVWTFYLPQFFIHLPKYAVFICLLQFVIHLPKYLLPHLTFNAEYDNDNLTGMAEAENMADLVDGYCRLVNQSSTSIWSRKGKKHLV